VLPHTYAAIPQTLAYMYVWQPQHSDYSTFNMVTNGSNFLFLKMEKSRQPEYAWSTEFSLLDPRSDRPLSIKPDPQKLKLNPQ